MTHWLCGWRVQSEIPLPELLPWLGDDRAVDLTIRLGRVPAQLDDLVYDGPVVQVAGDGTCRVSIENVADYLIDPAGREVVIAPACPVSEAAVRVFLLGTVFGVLCHKRNLLPLHASCLQLGAGAVAFAGPSGHGKSTLAARLVQRGQNLLADDVTVVDPDAPGGPVVWPAFPRLKLWRDAMTNFKLSVEGLEQGRVGMMRYHLPTLHAFDTAPRRLSAVYMLQWASEPRHETLVSVTGLQAIRHLRKSVYREVVGRVLVGEHRLFEAVSRLATTVPTYVLGRLQGFASFDEVVDNLIARHTAADAGASGAERAHAG